MTDLEIKHAFGGMSINHPFWLAVQAVLEQERETEQDAVCAPLLSDNERHYNAGRLARSKDTLHVLRGIMAEVKGGINELPGPPGNAR